MHGALQSRAKCHHPTVFYPESMMCHCKLQQVHTWSLSTLTWSLSTSPYSFSSSLIQDNAQWHFESTTMNATGHHHIDSTSQDVLLANGYALSPESKSWMVVSTQTSHHPQSVLPEWCRTCFARLWSHVRAGYLFGLWSPGMPQIRYKLGDETRRVTFLVADGSHIMGSRMKHGITVL
jgi:hypothetical protein